MFITSNLAIGPISSEIIEAVFRCSNDSQLMLIASKNQIDYNGGYVNNWTTNDYCQELNKLRSKYNKSNVVICRDHCGPGFNGNYELQDSYRTVEEDIKNGFDLIHFDLCHHNDNKLEETCKLIDFALSLKPDLKIEIGTDENTGNAKIDLVALEKEINLFLQFNPHFYVAQTGSLIMEINQFGTFDEKSVIQISNLIHSYGLKLKEHNADYLSIKDIRKRNGLVDAMNIAPQLGVVQTMYVVTQAKIFGIEVNPFIDLCYASNKWNKWFTRDADKILCSICCGHYNFSSGEYYKLYQEINEHFDLREGIIAELAKIINMYKKEFNENS